MSLELVPLRGENEFEPRPQNEVSVPFRGFFQKFRRSPRPFFYGRTPGIFSTLCSASIYCVIPSREPALLSCVTETELNGISARVVNES